MELLIDAWPFLADRLKANVNLIRCLGLYGEEKSGAN